MTTSNLGYRIDFENMQIVLSASFRKKASAINSHEYKMLTTLRMDFPDFKFANAIHPKARGKNSVTYEQMEIYLHTHRPDLLIEFNSRRAETIVLQGRAGEKDKIRNKYTFFHNRKWFINQVGNKAIEQINEDNEENSIIQEKEDCKILPLS